MRTVRVIMMGTALLLAAGCGGERLAEVERQSKRNEERLVRLEGMQKEILDQVEASRRDAAASLEKRVEELVARVFDAKVQAEIVKKIDEKMGGGQQLQAVIQTAVDSAIAQNEAQEKAEADAREAQRRQEWDQRRQESDNRRWAERQQSIGLNNDQVAKLRAASEEVRNQMRQIFEQTREQGGDFDQARQRGQALVAQFEASLSSYLTAEQIEAYKKTTGLFGMEGGGGRRGGGGEGGDRRGPEDGGGDRRGPPGGGGGRR